MEHIYDDGGRAQAGYKGEADDCATRAVAIAAQMPYQQVYDDLNEVAKTERRGTRQKGRSNARTGVYVATLKRYMSELGWQWVPTMQIGSGCTVHLRSEELPAGRIVARVSKHYCAVIDGVVYDTHDPTREGTRCVYGYWKLR
jgi:hypothetical protein